MQKISFLHDAMAQKRLDLALVFSLKEEPDPNMIYFTGYHGIGLLVVLNGKKPFLLVPGMEYERALKTGLKVFRTDKKKRLLETLAILLEKDKPSIKRIGIDELNCSVALFRNLRKSLKGSYRDISVDCDNIRMVKYDEEVACISKACSVTDKIFSAICENFDFKTELDIKRFIESGIAKEGCTPAFDPIVASGKNTSQPHYIASSKLQKGFLMLDFGARYKSYCSDMTRMIYLGRPSDEELVDYELVNKARDSCEKASLTKKKFSELYQLANEVLGEKSEFFTHGLGHGLGLEIHESPSLKEDDRNMIQDNIPFTVEPGIYFPGKYGIRIEDTVIIRKKRLIRLTKSSHKLIIVDKKLY